MGCENSINYALRIIKPILEGQASMLEVRRKAEEEYSEWMQGELRKTVWHSGCNNWYVRKPGQDNSGWNGSTYPWSQAHFWYRSLFPNFDDWEYSVSQYPEMQWTGVRGLTWILGNCETETLVVPPQKIIDFWCHCCGRGSGHED